MKRIFLLCLLLVLTVSVHASVTTHTGTFAASTSAGNQVVDTGTGVVGKAVIFWGHKVTTAGNAVNFEIFIGAATASTQEWAIWNEVADAAATSNTSGRFDDSKCLIIYNVNGSTPTANGEADFVSFGTGGDAGKFTIDWTDAPRSAYIIHYFFIAGADITNAKAGVFTYPTATGNQDVTAPGFTPDFTLLAGIAGGGDVLTAPNSRTHAAFFMGMATDSTDTTWGWKSENNRPSWDTYRYQNTNAVWTTIDNQANDDAATYVGGIASGFRLNWSALPGTAGTTEMFYLALAGGSYQVGNFTTQTSTGNFNVSTNFTGKGALFFSSLSTDNTHVAEAKMVVGGATSSSARGTVGGADNEGGEDADTRSSTSLIYTNISADTPTVNGEIDFVSFNASNMTLNQTDADPSGLPVMFFVIGDEPVAGSRRIFNVSRNIFPYLFERYA